MKKLLLMALMVMVAATGFAETPKTGSYRWNGSQFFDAANVFTGNQTYVGNQTVTGNTTQTGSVAATGTVTGTTGLSGGTASDSYLKTDTIAITNAEIKTLRASPKELVAAQGAGVITELVSLVLILDYGTNALTESTDNLVVEYEDGVDATAAIESGGFIDATEDQVALVVAATVPTITAAASANKALQLFNTGDGEIAGNAGLDTTITVKVTYRTHTSGL